MVRHTNINIIYAPLYIHSFSFEHPHASEKAAKFIELYKSPGQIHTVSDKLRYYRYEKGLMQKDVADLAGISRSTYLRYEEGGRDSYSLDIIKRIADVFSVPATELLDDYNLFLFNGQGRQIIEFREMKNMTQAELAEELGINTRILKKWELEKSKISKIMWEKLISMP